MFYDDAKRASIMQDIFRYIGVLLLSTLVVSAAVVIMKNGMLWLIS